MTEHVDYLQQFTDIPLDELPEEIVNTVTPARVRELAYAHLTNEDYWGSGERGWGEEEAMMLTHCLEDPALSEDERTVLVALLAQQIYAQSLDARNDPYRLHAIGDAVLAWNYTAPMDKNARVMLGRALSGYNPIRGQRSADQIVTGLLADLTK